MPDNKDEGRVVYTTAGDKATVRRGLGQVGKINQAVNTMLNGIKAFPLTRGSNQEEELQQFRDLINKTIDQETDRIVSADSGANGEDIAKFLNITFKNAKDRGADISARGMLQNQTLEEMMNDPTGQFDLILSNRYKNVNSLYEDIRLVTEQVAEMSEVIDTYRDAIINADNMNNAISSRLYFDGMTDNSSTQSQSMIATVHNMEDETGIVDKLKKIVIPNTLKYGNFYVFTQPYNDLFAKFKAMDDKYKLRGGPVQTSTMLLRESYTPTMEDSNAINAVFEEFASDFSSADEINGKKGKDKTTKESFHAMVESYINENVSVLNDELVPLLEDAEISALANPDMRKDIERAMKAKKENKTWNPIKSTTQGKFTDGVLNMAGADVKTAQDKYAKEFSEINGVFVKLYDPRRCIPVYVMDYCIGYYILYEVNPNGETNILNSVHAISRTTMLFRDDKKKEFEAKFVGLIADRICRSIDKSYLRQNKQFRELIANAIAYDNFYQKCFRVQFVPCNYMTHFKINVDYNTHLGVSVLYKSMFYSMLYLLMLLYTILIKVTRGSDLRMFLIKGNGVNKDISGKINKTISDFKQKQISYNDFGSVRGILSKVGDGKDIGVPVGANNERSFDIEQLPGVQVDMDTDLMQLLRRAMISTTGVPSAMINYMDEVDYARQLQMIHQKFMSRVITIQEETEGSVAELYKKLLIYGGYNIPEEYVDKLVFEWARPRTLNMQGMADLISTSDQIAEFMVKIFEGENTTNDPRVKDRILAHMVKNYIMPGVFDWDGLQSELDPIYLRLRDQIKEEEQTKITAEDQSSE